MKINKKLIKMIFGISLLSFLVLSIAWAALAPGKKAPDFKLESTSGKQITLAQLKANPAKKGSYRVVLVDFWATWCPPCRESIPFLQKMHDKYSKKGLVVAGISLDDNIQEVKTYAKNNKLKYTLLLDKDKKAAKKYGVSSIPTIFLIDKSGKIKYVHVGLSEDLEKQLEKEIKLLLK